MSDLTKDGNDVCFRRDYDAAHLKKNPRQQVTSMTVWIAGSGDMRSGNTGLALTRRGDPAAAVPRRATAVGATSTVRRRTGCRRSRRKPAQAASPWRVPDVFPESSSAKEGGGVILDPAPDGKTMIVHLDDSPSMVKRGARRWKIVPLKLGRDDRVFLLRRTALKDCDFVKEALTTMEPDRRK